MDSTKVLLLGSKSIAENIKWSVFMYFVQLFDLIKYVSESIKSTDTFILVVPGYILKKLRDDPIFNFEQVRHIYSYYDSDDDLERDKYHIKDEHGKLRFLHEQNLKILIEKLKADYAINSPSPNFREPVNDVASSLEQHISAKRSNDVKRHSPKPKTFASTSKHGLSVKHIEQIDSHYICPSCEFLFRDPYQLECGDRICQSCIKHENNQTTCITCFHVSLNENIWQDRGFHNDMLSLPVSCSSCDWTGSFKNYQTHIDQKHPDGDSNTSTMDVYTQRVRTNQRRLDESVYTTEISQQIISDSLSPSRSIYMPNNSNVINDPYYILLTHFQEMIDVMSHRVNIISNDQQRLAAELRRSQTSIQTVNQNLFSIEAASEDILNRARGLKNIQELIAQQVWSLKQAVNEALSTSFDGTYIWKITGVHEKRADAQSERQKSIYSHPFYSSPTGYKMCMRLYLNGDGDTRDKYLSLFLVIMRGDYDAILEWPFPYQVSFRIIDQSKSSDNQVDAIHSLWPDISSDCFKRPVYSMNDGDGFKEFLSLPQFEQNQNRFVKDDTMFISAKIEFFSKQSVLASSSSTDRSPNDEAHVDIISEDFTHMS